MKKPVVLIGIGEMGGVFARGFLRLGHPVYPITRAIDLTNAATSYPEPEAVLIAVAENDIQTVLETFPPTWIDRVCLLQNELLPPDWEGIPDPTVISVWFEKKPGADSKVIIPSPVYGPHAELLAEALGKVDISSRVLASSDELLFELVLKNVYILTSNIAGLRVGGTVGELWNNHQAFAKQLASEVISLQEALTRLTFEHEQLIQAMRTAFDGDPEHKCMGRSAPARLERATQHADTTGTAIPLMREIQQETASG